MLNDKEPEFWAAIAAGIGLVILRHKEQPWLNRIGISAVSGGMGFALAPDLALWSGASETLAAGVLTGFGYIFADVLASIAADRQFFIDLIKRRVGGGK